MGITDFPNGLSSFGVPVISGFGSEEIVTGNAFFVDSGHVLASDGNEAVSPDTPAATIDGCIAKCTADNGDVIFVMPGHDENPVTSITLDVAGVWVRGLGWGNDRPTITFGAAGATVAMSAASTRISNIIFDLGDVAATVTNAINITAAGCIVENCETKPHATSQFTNFITVTTVEDVTIRNNRFVGKAASSGTNGIVVNGCDYIRIYGNYVSGLFISHALNNATDEVLRSYIASNIFENVSDSGTSVTLDALATGVFAHNLLGTGLDFEAGFINGNVSLWGNYMCDSSGTSGAIIPTALSTS